MGKDSNERKKITKQNLTQIEAAEILEVDQPKISALSNLLAWQG
ncbi:XRE family transcriptional regulator [Fischerella thermalis]|nr:XRE family transcriptional regulator [Fischerella thermalis]